MKLVKIRLSDTNNRNILYGFLFAFCVFLPSTLTTPVKTKEHSGIVVDFHQQKKDLACLTEVVYYEALNQSKEGMKAVLTVVLNRKQARGFPDSICGVVHQPKHFSYRNKVKPGVALKPQPKNPADKLALMKIQSLSRSVVQGTFKPNLPRGVLWYTKHSVQKSWMRDMTIVARIDSHKFMAEN